jgi:hypothetical protein
MTGHMRRELERRDSIAKRGGLVTIEHNRESAHVERLEVEHRVAGGPADAAVHRQEITSEVGPLIRMSPAHDLPSIVALTSMSSARMVSDAQRSPFGF